MIGILDRQTLHQHLRQTATGFVTVALALELAVITPVFASAPAKQSPPALASAETRLGKLGLSWVPNAGQWDSRAAFRAQSFAGSVWMTTEGVLLHQFNGPRATGCTSAAATEESSPARAPACPRAPGWVLAERFVGGKIGAAQGRDQAVGRVSYEVGAPERHAHDLPTYGWLDLGEVYPGVHVGLKASQSNVEKLYTVAPGRDPGVIRMQLEGAAAVRIAADGALEAHTGHGPVRFTPPIAFQEDTQGARQQVPVSYTLATSVTPTPGQVQYGFVLGAYDRSRPLTIDPLLQSTYLGGDGSDTAWALAIHPVSGEVYVAGETSSTDLPGIGGTSQDVKGAAIDAFVSRFNPELTTRLQSTYLGGSDNDFAYAIAIHPITGEVYLAGATFSIDLPGVSGGAQSTGSLGYDAFISRFNAQLTARLQSTFLAGNGDDTARAVAIHPVTGDVYVAGNTTSSDLPGVAGGAQAVKGAGNDGFVSRFNAQLTTRLQSTYLGAVGADIARAVAIHPLSGEVYVAGQTASPDFPGVAGGAQATYGNGADAFIVRLNTQLTNRVQATFVGGSGGDWAQAIAIHPLTGDVYIAGATNSTNFPGVAGGPQTALGGGNDAFVLRVNAQLTSRLQATYLGGNGNETAYALAIHPLSGEIYVAGSTASTDLPGVAGGVQAVKGALDDGFVVRFNAQLTSRLQSTYLGGAGTDFAYALAIPLVTGDVYVAGSTDTTGWPGVAGGAQSAKSTDTDAFISRLSLDLSSAAVVPAAFVLPAQFGVPVASLRTAGPVQITGLGSAAPVMIDGALGSAVCISTSATCSSCNASPGGVFGPNGSIANNQYLCVRHLSAPTLGTYAESRVVVGGFAAKFSTFTGAAPCALDMNADNVVSATQEGLVLLRALLGLSPAATVAGTGISGAQWAARRTALIACGNALP